MEKNCIKDSLDYATIFTGMSANKLRSASFSRNGRRTWKTDILCRYFRSQEIFCSSGNTYIIRMPFPWKLFPPWKYLNSVMYTLLGLDLWLRVFVCSSTLLQEAAASGARRLVNYWSDTCRKRNMRKRPQRHRSACTTNRRVRAVLLQHSTQQPRLQATYYLLPWKKRWAVCTCVESELQDLALRPGPIAYAHSWPRHYPSHFIVTRRLHI